MATHIVEPTKQYSSPSEFVIYLSNVAEEIPPWGQAPALRDLKLRQFWPTEPTLAGSLFSITAKYAGAGFTLTGDPELVEIAQKLLTVGCEFSKGWTQLITKTLIDLFTQDNGAFWEIVRTRKDPTAPVIQINHLDAGRCIRTGRRDKPVIYSDIKGKFHELESFEVITFEEMPSPIETMYGLQYSVLTRILRAAEIARDISIYNREKVSGKFVRAIHLVSGINTRIIEDVLQKQRTQMDIDGFVRYIQPAIIGSLDPTANVSVSTIEMAKLPDGFDEEKFMRWYINNLALAFGADYQELAPLPGGGLGSAEQSKMLNIKSRSKGPRLFKKNLEFVMNHYGLLPPGVVFKYGDKDILEDMDASRLSRNRAEERKTRIESGEITPEIARQIAQDSGDLDEKYLNALNEVDITPVTLGGE